MGIDKGMNRLKPAELRRQAEKQLQVKTPDAFVPRSDEETLKLVHELEVHQIELEMQNAELQQAREEVETTLDRYTDLYDFAPVGYFTLDRDGAVIAANLTGAGILGIDRAKLLNRRFGLYVADEDKLLFNDFLAKVFASQNRESCELALTAEGNSPLFVRIEAVVTAAGDECQVAVIDITASKQTEEKLQAAHNEMELRVSERTRELTCVNAQLSQEIEDRKRTEESLHGAYAEIKQMKNRLDAENIYLQQEVDREYNFGEAIGQSSAFSFVFLRVGQVAPMNATVLLLGETGTGKGIVARAIHSRSTRKDRPMITVNCTALPANLIESELFGRERGAFTGANDRQIGRFELADGGTIFLDEIGEMPLELQCKLLRVIQDGEFERLGSPRTIKVDVRIIAASNRNLVEEIKNGTFREDLYYRLNVFPIMIPPLRQRKEDIPLLVNHFVAKFNKKNKKMIETVPKETMAALLEYHWPGNVRELESVIERAVITSQGRTLKVLDRFDAFRKTEEPADGNVKGLVEMEHDHILQVLKRTSWRIEGKNGAAILLGINPSTLRARMRKYGILR